MGGDHPPGQAVDGATAARVRELMQQFSIEVTPRELDQLASFGPLLAPGTAVFITWLSNVGFEGTVAVARRLAEAGLVPVPHVAARAVGSEEGLAFGRTARWARAIEEGRFTMPAIDQIAITG